MHKTALLVLFICFFSTAFSQRKAVVKEIGDIFYNEARSYKDEELEDLKKTTTVFFYNNQSRQFLDSLISAVKSAWDITPLIFEPYDSAEKYLGNSSYSTFVIEGGERKIWSKSNGGYVQVQNPHYYLVLSLPFVGGLCRIELYPNYETQKSGWDASAVNKKGVFYNWSPVILKAQLTKVSEDLKNNFRSSLFFVRKVKESGSLLLDDTIFISKKNLFDYSKDLKRDKEISADIFRNLKFPYRICGETELFDIFVTHKRGRFLFEYVNSDDLKFIIIYDCLEREVIYRNFSKGKNLTQDDIKLIE